jgi:hypothetical protein
LSVQLFDVHCRLSATWTHTAPEASCRCI